MIGKKDTPKIERGNTRVALKAGFWYVVSTFFVKGLAFITTPIFARLMTEADYGEFSNYANWQSMLLIIIGVELFNTLSRAYYDYTDEYDGYASSITIASIILTVIFYFIFLLCNNWIYNIVSIPPEYVHILFFSLMFQSCKTIYFAKERTLYKYKSVAVLSVLSLALPTIISVVLVALAQDINKLSARIYGFYIPYALIGVYCTIVLLKKGKTFKWAHLKYAFILAIPLLAHYFTAYLLTSTNVIITKSIDGAEAAAIVSIAASVMQILTMLFQAVTGALTTWIMDNLHQNNIEKIKKCGIIFTFSIAVLVIGVVIFGPELVKIIGGAKYVQSVDLLPAWAISIFFQTVTTIFTIMLTYDKNIVKTAIITGLVAVLSIFAKILLLPEHGYQIFPFVNALAFGILFIGNYLLIIKAGYSSYVNIRAIISIIILTIALTVICHILYDYNFIRYLVIVIVSIFAVIFAYLKREILLSFALKKQNNK